MYKRQVPAKTYFYLDRNRISQLLRNLITGNKETSQLAVEKLNNKMLRNLTQTNKDTNKENIYSAFFERLWVQYPNKRGKGRISDKKKKELYELVGEEQLERCIQRYVDDLSQNDWRKPQNGSTFFNSGYVDYLDVNYSKETAGYERMQRCEDGTFKLM